MNVLEQMKRNIEEAEAALISKPLFATSAERVALYEALRLQDRELPQPIRFARYLSFLLSRVSTPLEPYDRIAGRCVDRELNEEEEARFQALLRDPDNPKKTTLPNSGHCTFSWELLVEEGLPGLRARVGARLEGEMDPDRRTFLEGTLGVYDAIEAYLLRYARAAEEKGMTRVADHLRRAALSRPDRFGAALQLLWIITLINCAYITPNPTLTVGRLDRILLPLYRADLAAGRLTREEAAMDITDYYCKHNLIMGRGEHQIGNASNSTTFQRIFCFDAPQYLLLGGTDEKGESAVNELTELFAEQLRPAFKNPVAVVRYFPGMNERYPSLWRTLTEKALESASLMFYNDDNVIRTFRRMGLPEEECRNYAHFGCNWASPGDRSAWMLGGPSSARFGTQASAEEAKELNIPFMRTNSPHSWPEDFVIVLRELAAREEGSVTIEDFYQGFFDRMGEFIDRKLTYLAKELTVRKRRPSAILTFADCFLRDSLRSAECYGAGAPYHFELQSFQMFGTVADCFIVTDKLVFLDRVLTLSELSEAVERNFEGREDVLALCRRVEKYGSDTPHSNAHVKRLAETASALVIEKNRPYLKAMGLFLTPCMQSDTWHLQYGSTYGATPDGRLAGEAYSQNMRPSNGACVSGLTAMLNSMLYIPSDGLVSGSLNLDVDPSQFEGEQGRARFGALLASYFNRGGFHAQVSGGSAEVLMDAQAHPERHRDLRVRITGYSGVFVDVSKPLQDDIIERFR